MDNMNVQEILRYLPHRYPFMLVDRVLKYNEKDESLLALKNVTYNEPFFIGHFPAKPVMPGVLVVEALAQAAGLLVFLLTKDTEIFYFAGIDNTRFKRIIEPGDQLHLHVKVDKHKRDVWRFNAKATVNGDIVCTGDLMVAR